MKKKPMILLTRQKGLNESDVLRFTQAGYEVSVCPLLTLRFLPIPKDVQKSLIQADWVLFTSQTPVPQIVPLLREQTKIAVIGEKTAKAVCKLNREVDFISPQETKRAFLATFKEAYPQVGRVFYPKSQLADDYIETQLQTTAKVTSQVTYLNLPAKDGLKRCSHLLQEKAIDGVYLTSASAAKRFLAVVEETGTTNQLLYFAIGATTQSYLAKRGIASHLISELERVDGNC
ncbi:uroporphyrinogen-III synthase [Enterococcus asini]|uniref:uroporphyrinogen-III synthase n=1 Tax=Enterococcus asini TaxID=57732 RepID=UPI0026DC5D19|nr:uroporphyrinogen-III synthase [Enterococcus asini]